MSNIDQAAVKCVKAAVMSAVVLVCGVLLSNANLWWLIPATLTVYPLALFYGFLYGMFLTADDFQVMSDEDQAELSESLDTKPQEPEYFFEEVDDTTELSPEVIGRFKDTDIHEYVIVNNPAKPGEKLTCTFSHVIYDIDKFAVPVGCWFVLLMPGIVYTAPVEPEFTKMNTRHVQ